MMEKENLCFNQTTAYKFLQGDPIFRVLNFKDHLDWLLNLQDMNVGETLCRLWKNIFQVKSQKEGMLRRYGSIEKDKGLHL